ncbi:MAG TPA: AAA family ATPase [Candidatus Dormibacteraeota bacterium]|nr:AAA family ATPase [Candidatus Dormibacteraeota bacterium]
MRRYFTHFGLVRDPFLDTADPEFYCETPHVKEAKARLQTSVNDGRGLVVVTGPVGAGKTSLSAALELECLKDESVAFGKILDPTFGNEVEMLIAIGRVFGLSLPPRSSASLKNALKNLFFDIGVLEDRAIVLVVDEAQLLEPFGLEVLRLLLNYQVPEKKLLNVLLFGQPELAERVRARQNVADRVDQWVELAPLDPGELAALLRHRLTRAGLPEGQRIFSEEALEAVVRASGGYPRRAIIVAHAAMVAAAETGAGGVFSEHVDDAVRRAGGSALPFIVAEPPVAVAAPGPQAPETGGAAEPPPLPARGWWSGMLERVFPSTAGERR